MYTTKNLPPVQNDSAGYMLPNQEEGSVAFRAPCDLDWPYPTGWGKKPGATMPVKKGQWIVSAGVGDSYLNAEADDTCTFAGKVDVHNERRIDMIKVMSDIGISAEGVEFTMATKTVGAIVVGIVAAEGVGEQFLGIEGPEVLKDGDAVLMSPRRNDVLYKIDPVKRAKRYTEQGRIFPGELPAQYR